MTDAEFDSKPQVMLVGQYSVGKTSFIKYILGKDFPGQRIGPEPTTDRFVAVMDGPDERVIPGNALAVSHDLPYRGLERFGVAFLNRFEGSQLPCKVLRNITLIDTPGVLSGEKQRVNRGYDFTQVTAWFAARADLILMLFDAHKLDISDEFRNVIESLKGNDDKIRCILNKADQVDRQKLMRVYGALMWSLGKVCRIYTTQHSLVVLVRTSHAHTPLLPGGENPRGTARVHWVVLGPAAGLRGQRHALRDGGKGPHARPTGLAAQQRCAEDQRTREARAHLQGASLRRCRAPRVCHARTPPSPK